MKISSTHRNRRKIVVNTRFQRLYVLSFVLVAVMVFNALLLYVVAFHDPLLFSRVSYFNPTGVALFELTMIAAATAYGLLRSRQLAGPVQGLLRVMRCLDEGDFSARLALRKGEFFEDVLHDFNGSLDRLEQRIVDLQEEARSARQILRSQGQDASALDRMAAMLDELRAGPAAAAGTRQQPTGAEYSERPPAAQRVEGTAD